MDKRDLAEGVVAIIIAITLAALAFSGAGCIRMQRGARVAVAVSSPERCDKLSTRVTLLHVLGIVFGGIGTASTSVAAALSDNVLGRDLALGGGGLFGLAGAVVSYVGGVDAASFSKECP